MPWKVDFYDKKVKEDIKDWPAHIKAKFAKIVELIEKVGPKEVGMPRIKPLGQGLFEIRIKSDEGIARALFGMIKGQIIIILCGFIKKTQKTPTREMNLAKERLEEIKNEQKTKL
jgi:phage-related protein